MALESILSNIKHIIFLNKGDFNQNKDRGQISKIEDSPLKKPTRWSDYE